MDKGKINASELFCLIVLFELGSAVVVGVGLEAQQDAWLAILLGMAGGLGLYTLYARLIGWYPGLPFTAIIPRILGKPAGIPVSAAYIVYFLYIAARVMRDFGELLITSTLTQTPLAAINCLMAFVVMYAVYRGIEGIGRTAQTVYFVMLASLLLGMVFLVLSGKIDPVRLLPFLEKGWRPLVKTVLTQTYTFPFGEMVVFTMLLPLLNRQDAVLRTGLKAMVTAGVVLALTIACDIAVLGVKQASISQFPLLDTFSKVNIGQFIARLDILVVSMLILGMFIKITVFFYAGVSGITAAFRIGRDFHRLLLTLGLGTGVMLWSIFMSGSFTEHIRVGLKWVPLYLHWPLQTLIPIVLFGVAYLKDRMRNRA